MTTLALPGVDTLPPQRARRGALSQWFTPPWLAQRMARWGSPFCGRVLEPSAGSGALVRAWRERVAAHRAEWEAEHGTQLDIADALDCVEIDPVFAEVHGFECADYLTRPAPAERYQLGLCNPPYEGGLDGLFVEKLMSECDRVIVLLRLAALCGADRHERVWSQIGNGWAMPGLAMLSSRPVFDGPEEACGSAKSDFVVVKLRRGTGTGTFVEWWRESDALGREAAE